MTKKHKIIIIISVVAVILFTIIMALTKIGLGTGDWKYELKNNYQIWRVNSKEIIIGKEEDGVLTPSINENVVKFKYNDNFVLVGTNNNFNEDNLKYYIINLDTDKIIGPLNKKDLSSQNSNITMDWIKTKPAPKDAKYE